MSTAIERVIRTVASIRDTQERESTREFPRTFGELLGEYQSLPGLVAFWPLSSIDRSSGDALDISGQGRTLTFNGNPTYNLYNSVVPYIDLDGAGDFLSRADETDLDILGTEAIYASARRGLTLGAWINQDDITGDQGIIGKWTTAGNLRQYRLYSNAGTITLGISSNGTTDNAYAGTAAPDSVWNFCVGRWTPSTTGDVFVNGIKTSNVSAVASMSNQTPAFRVGDRGDGTTLLTGNIALPFLCANNLPDSRIMRLYNLGRLFFGV